MSISNDMMIGSLNHLKQAEDKKMNSDLDMEQFLYIISNAMSMPSFDGGGSGGSETDYIGQMVQFGMLNAMQDLTQTMETNLLINHQQQAFSFIGKQVTLTGEEDQLVTGVVEKVRFEGGIATLQVNGTPYQMSDVIEVSQ